MWDQENYLKALDFAARAHAKQEVPGKQYTYVVHLAEVVQEIMAAAAGSREEIDADFAVQCALLHDTIEDTDVSYEDIAGEFGETVADGVLALSKDEKLPKEIQMQDSLERIKKQPKEVWMVKLADRISNLRPRDFWTYERNAAYHREAIFILNELKDASPFLAERLTQKIETFLRYIKRQSP